MHLFRVTVSVQCKHEALPLQGAARQIGILRAPVEVLPTHLAAGLLCVPYPARWESQEPPGPPIPTPGYVIAT